MLKMPFMLYANVTILPCLIFFFFWPYPGFESDIGTFGAWAYRLNAVPLGEFYQKEYFCDYFPAYLYVLKFLGWFANLVQLPLHGPGSQLLLKAPALVAHIIMMIQISYFREPLFKGFDLSDQKLGFAIIFCSLWPAQIQNIVFFGQCDAVFNLIAFNYICALRWNKLGKSALLWGLLCSFKPLAILLLPFTMFSFYWYPKLRSLRSVIYFTVVSFITILSLHAPFWIDKPWQDFLDHLLNTSRSYPFATVNAFNLYFLMGLNWLPIDSSKFMGMPLAAIWLLAFGIYMMFATYLLTIKREDKKSDTLLFLLSTLGILILFMTLPKMHERYLMPIFPMFIPVFVYSRLTSLCFLLVGICLALNQQIIVEFYSPLKIPFDAHLANFCGYCYLLVILALIIESIRSTRKT